jgi:hypothetical protein
MVNTQGAVALGGAPKSTLSLPWQVQSWRFYGAPDGTIAAGLRLNQGAIGEVRFVMGWVAQQIGRVAWNVKIGDKPLDQNEAAEMMKKVANVESTIIIATNLIVAGELHYVAVPLDELEPLTGNPHWDTIAGPALPGTDDARWLAISVIEKRRDEILKGAKLNLRAIWPHPAAQTVPDPPLRSVLDILAEIEQLQDLAFSQNRSRIAQMGILTVANEFDMAVPGGDFGKALEQAITAPIVDPRQSSASPILLRGPFELMTGSLSNGARGVQWTKPAQDFDERLDDKMRFLIQRLAWGFPVAPEILLGMTATNRAVAFQIEESTYRSHVEPIANLVGRVYAGALRLILADEKQHVEVTPDATELLARRHSVADAKDAYDRGLTSGVWVRRVLGISEEDAATPEDLARILLLKGKSDQGREADPSEVSGNEPVKASLSLEDTPRAQLIEAINSAMAIAHSSAVARIGAAARTKLARMTLTPVLEIDPELTNNRRLPSLLGPDRLTELNVKVQQCISPQTEWLADWWELRLGDEARCPDSDAVRESCKVLRETFTSWSAGAITAWPFPRVPERAADLVLIAAFGLAELTESGGVA